MKRILLTAILCLTLILPVISAETSSYEAINILNSSLWAQYFEENLGFLYDSHGCLHFMPSDIYLLTRPIPAGTPLNIKSYNETEITEEMENLPVFNEVVNSTQDVLNYAQTFKDHPAKIIVYPGLEKLFIYVNGLPHLQLHTLPGPPPEYRMVFDLKKDGQIVWDFTTSTPTDPGSYTTLKSISRYLSNLYYLNTIVPFGAWMVKRNDGWAYQEGKRWYALPEFITADLSLPDAQRQHNYFDVNKDGRGKTVAARWGSNDFR